MPSFHDPFRPKSRIPEGYESTKAEVHDPAEEANKVPSGTLKELKAWIDDDPDRAQAALDAEEAHEEPRKSVIAELKKIIKKADNE